jgi:hypothetical protein
MTCDTPASADVARFTLAIDDLQQASEAARLIADHDRDLAFAERIREIGLDAAVAEVEATPPTTALGDFCLRGILETGLIVTMRGASRRATEPAFRYLKNSYRTRSGSFMTTC